MSGAVTNNGLKLHSAGTSNPDTNIPRHYYFFRVPPLISPPGICAI